MAPCGDLKTLRASFDMTESERNTVSLESTQTNTHTNKQIHAFCSQKLLRCNNNEVDQALTGASTWTCDCTSKRMLFHSELNTASVFSCDTVCLGLANEPPTLVTLESGLWIKGRDSFEDVAFAF